MINKKLIQVLKQEVAELSHSLRQLHHTSHIVYWNFGLKEIKSNKSKEWIDLGKAIKEAEGIMQTTRSVKKH